MAKKPIVTKKYVAVQSGAVFRVFENVTTDGDSVGESNWVDDVSDTSYDTKKEAQRVARRLNNKRK